MNKKGGFLEILFLGVRLSSHKYDEHVFTRENVLLLLLAFIQTCVPCSFLFAFFQSLNKKAQKNGLIVHANCELQITKSFHCET